MGNREIGIGYKEFDVNKNSKIYENIIGIICYYDDGGDIHGK